MLYQCTRIYSLCCINVHVFTLRVVSMYTYLLSVLYQCTCIYSLCCINVHVFTLCVVSMYMYLLSMLYRCTCIYSLCCINVFVLLSRMTVRCGCSYDPREDKWTVLAEMGTARALAGCTVYQNKIYVIGTLSLFTSAA